MAQFKVGNVVMLKSGGPKMTVEAVGIDDETGKPVVVCSWFDGVTKVSETFAAESLQLA